MNERRTTWSFGKGMGWAVPCGLGAMFGVRKRMAYAIGFDEDYSLLFVILAVFGVALWLGGLRRVPRERADQEDAIWQRVSDLSKAGDEDVEEE